MNYDLWYRIGLHLDYETLYNLFQTNIEITTLRYSNYFWLLKSRKDFSVPNSECDRLFKKLKTGKEVYLYFAGINGIPIVGSERYGDLRFLIRMAALSENNRFLTQFIDMKWDNKNLKILGKRNSSLISKLILNDMGQLNVVLGAIRGNHLSLVKELIAKYPPIDSSHYYLLFQKAIRSENFEILDFLSRKYRSPYLNTNTESEHKFKADLDVKPMTSFLGLPVLSSNSEHKFNTDLEVKAVTSYLSIPVLSADSIYNSESDYESDSDCESESDYESKSDCESESDYESKSDCEFDYDDNGCPKDGSIILFDACVTGNLEMVKYIMGKRKCGPQDYNSGLCGAAKAGNTQLMDLMFSLGAYDLYEAMIGAAKGHHLSIILDMYNQGCDDLSVALNYMFMGGNLETIEKLIELGADIYDINSKLLSACWGNNLPVIRYLMSKINQASLVFLSRLINSRQFLSIDILNTILEYIDKVNYPQVLLLSAQNNLPLWFNRMLDAGANFPEPYIINIIIKNKQLPAIVELIHRGLDYKKYIHLMDHKLENYLIQHFG